MKATTPVLKAGLCAYGMSGKVFHAPFLHTHPGFQLYAIVERHAKTARESYPDTLSYASVEELLEDKHIDVVVVNSPNITHYDFIKRALLAGKHVIAEKPFTATANEAAELIRLARQQDKFLAVFQNRRWDSDYLAVKQVIKEQLIGELIEAEFHFDRYRMELSQKKHKEIPQPGVGNIYDLGPHIVDQAIDLLGKPDGVFGIVQTHRAAATVDDFFEITLLYHRLTVTLKSSLLVREPVPAYILQGTLGSFLKPRADVQETDLQAGKSPTGKNWGREPASGKGLLHTLINGEPVRKKLAAPPGNYHHFYTGVYEAIVHGKPSPVPLADSLLNIQIIEAALQSSRERQVVKL